MKILYTPSEFNNAKCNDTLALECSYCKQSFKVKKKLIQTILNGHSRKTRTCNFCSIKCRCSVHTLILNCEYCKKQFKTNLSQYNKNAKHFCSRSCSASYYNRHKTKGTNISKIEIWIQKQLNIKYPQYKFCFNQRQAINEELDIYIPSLRLAFELNGIFHYKPIFGNEKLIKTQKTDQTKIELCQKNNISLYVIDISREKYFKETHSQKFLDIITNIINSHDTNITCLIK